MSQSSAVWSQEEIHFLIERFDDLTTAQLAHLLQRSIVTGEKRHSTDDDSNQHALRSFETPAWSHPLRELESTGPYTTYINTVPRSKENT